MSQFSLYYFVVFLVELHISEAILDDRWLLVQGGSVAYNDVESFQNVTIDECLESCQANGACLSVDYSYEGNCYFNSETWATAPGDARPNNNLYVYVERSSSSQDGS